MELFELNIVADEVYERLSSRFDKADTGYIISKCLILAFEASHNKDLSLVSNMMDELKKGILLALTLKGFK